MDTSNPSCQWDKRESDSIYSVLIYVHTSPLRTLLTPPPPPCLSLSTHFHPWFHLPHPSNLVALNDEQLFPWLKKKASYVIQQTLWPGRQVFVWTEHFWLWTNRKHVRSLPEEPHLAWGDVTFSDFRHLSWAYFLCKWAKILICWCLTLLE